ncbi:MAG: hypothetical protein ABEI98_01970 [Halorhabdus sp.]
MDRRSVLRSIAGLTPLALAGCGEYSADPEATPRDQDKDTTIKRKTQTETVPVNPEALEVTYSRRHYQSDGEAVAQLTVKNTAQHRVRAALIVHFTASEVTKTVTEVIEVPGEERKRFRIPLGEPVKDVILQDFTFEIPS